MGTASCKHVISSYRAVRVEPVRLCVRLSVTFVHCSHRVQWILDTFACFNRWMPLLLTDNASPGSSDGMMPGFLVEERAVWKKLVIVAISLIF